MTDLLSQTKDEINILKHHLQLPNFYLPRRIKSQGLIDNINNNKASFLIGDNLSWLLTLLEQSKNSDGLIDFCYVDAPYNTKSKMVYSDNRSGKAQGAFAKHSYWMAFILPRLQAVKNLLKPTGIVAFSIDENEHPYAKILLDNIFGEDNCMGTVVVLRSKNGRGNARNIASTHEYLIFYGKSKKSRLLGDIDTKKYNQQDSHGYFNTNGLLRKKGDDSRREDRPNLFYPLYYQKSTHKVSATPKDDFVQVLPIDPKGIERRWIWSHAKAVANEHLLFASVNGTIYVKDYSRNLKRIKLRSVWDNPKFYTQAATSEIKEIFGDKVFDTPKSVEFLRHVINVSIGQGMVLDLFAGSAALAQALFDNCDQELKKNPFQLIMMETDDVVPTNHIAKASGFQKIADITQFRLNAIKISQPNFNYWKQSS